MPFSPEKRRAYDAARKRSSANRNGARTIHRTKNLTDFVGIDGEGVMRPDGKHDYNLLSLGDQSLHHPDGSRLTTGEIFDWLWENHDPKAAYVGFFLGYDFSQWFKDLPEERARMLFSKPGQAARRRHSSGGNSTPFPVEWKRWEFDMLPNEKRFKLRPHRSRAPWLFICDTGPIFQTSFLAAIDPSEWPEPFCSNEEYVQILRGKQQRGLETTPYGTPVDVDTIRYNLLENDVLARLMERTNAGMVAMGIKLKRTQWFGPGQAAQEWLKNTAREHTAKRILENAEQRGVLVETVVAFEAARASYFGGWFEITAHGPVAGVTHEYDINSAYPHIIAALPCLLHGSWEYGEGAPPDRVDRWRLVYASLSGSDPVLGTMLHRTAKGRVLRPQATEGWYWQHELDAAVAAGLVDRVDYHRWFVYHACSCEPPFAAIRDLYEHRLTAGKKSPQGKAMKLVYNSSYGKMAQSIGMPMFGNPVYASLITAGCRAMITEAIATHPQQSSAVVMIATDGVYFTSPHPTLPLDPQKLGAWDVAEKVNISLFKPGVYWDDNTREQLKNGGKLKIKSRGVNAKALGQWVPQIDNQWHLFTLTPDPNQWPSADLEVPFSVVTPKQALNRNKWELCGHVEVVRPVKFSSHPMHKRICAPPQGFSDGLYRSRPYPKADKLQSTPYDRRFGMELRENEELHGVETAIGPASTLMSITD